MPSDDVRPSDHIRPISAPPGRDLAEWLSTYDATPTILPEWPESIAMAVVMVTTRTIGFEMVAHVVLAEKALRQAATAVTLPQGISRLFFTVPRSFLLKANLGLTENSWVDHA